MKVLRTPDACFDNLKDYDFSPNYLDVTDELRMHYVDEGHSENGEVILMLHGEPSWSYLYRHMIRYCVDAGYRVVAPDLIGFGKSDKPAAIKDYSYLSHMDWLKSFIHKLDLNNITLFCQDWGSLLGLRLAAEEEPRFSRIILGNGMLPTGELPKGQGLINPAPLMFLTWRTFAQFSPWFPIGRIVDFGTGKNLSPEEVHAYNAPFPKKKYLAGARAFPLLVPITPNNPATEANKAAWEILENWKKPFLTCFSTGDPMLGPFDKLFQERVPGTRGLPHRRVFGGHFLQEDSPHEISQAIVELIEQTS